MRLALSIIAEAIGARVIGALPDQDVDAYSTDSRTQPPGALFFALRGETFDGHDHVLTAFEKGAAAAVVDRTVSGAGPLLVVSDTLKALQQLGRFGRKRWPGTAIGVTGSAGKTTTKDAIAAVLGATRRVGKTDGNYNNHIGVPLSVLHLPDDAELAVLEIGMNHAGEIRDLSQIALPDIGVVTNVGAAHIENFSDVDGIARAKRELIEALPPTGVAVLNADDPRVASFAAIHPGRTITYGLSEKARLRATGVDFGFDSSRFSLPGAGRFVCGLPGRSGVLTALAALACAQAVGVPLESARGAIAGLTAGKMRLERFQHAGMTVWNDCYNSNPEAAMMMLDLLTSTPAHRHVAVLGEMLELGRWSKDLHRDVGRYAAQCGVTVLVGIRGAAEILVDSAVDAGLSPSAAFFFPEPREAGRFLKGLAQEGDAVLFKGSRGTRVEIALEEFLH